MNKFTLKDAIIYSKCINCNKPPTISFYILDHKDNTSKEIKAIFNKTYLEFNLRINYRNSLNIQVYYKNNKFETNNMNDLTLYLKKTNISLRASCNKCHSQIIFNLLDFNLNKQFLEPLEINRECVSVFEKDRLYVLLSDYDKKNTKLIIDKLSITGKINLFKIDLPLIKKTSFKNKSNFLDKISKYVVFS